MPLTDIDVISNSPFAVLQHQLDAELTIVSASGDLSQIGWSNLESSQFPKSFRELLWKGDFDDLNASIVLATKSHQKSVTAELHLLDQSNTWRWVEVNLSIIYDENKQAISLLAFVKDITERKLSEDNLFEEHEEYFLLFEHNRAVQLLIDPDSQQIIRGNRAARRFYGYEEEQLKGLPVSELHVLSTDEVITQMKLAKQEGKANFDTKHKLKNGEVRQVSVFIGPLLLRNKQLLYTIVFDVTDQKRAQQELKTLTSAIQSSASSIFITDVQGVIEYVNPRFTEVTGYEKNEVVGKTPAILKTEHTDPQTHQDLWSTIQAGEQWRGELYNRTKCGTCYWSLTTISPIHDDDTGEISNFVAVSEDITDRINKYQHMERLALFDPLTHLANRRLLEQSLVEVKTRILREQDSEDALVLMDLDGFKQVNDTHGHDVGDKLLQVIARRLQNCARSTDLVCRLGGDEFAVVLRTMRTTESLAKWCENTLTQLREPVEIVDGVIVQVSASMGAIQLNECLSEPSDWLRETDELMYKVKQDGRNNYRLAEEFEEV